MRAFTTLRGAISFAFYLLKYTLPALGQSTATLPQPGQPSATGAIGQFEIVGSSLVSAQQVSPLFFTVCTSNPYHNMV